MKKHPSNFQEFTESVRKPAPPDYCDFWSTLYDSQIICKIPPDSIDKNRLKFELFLYYMDIEEDQTVLKNNVMLNSENVLILNDGKLVEAKLNGGDECKFIVLGNIKMDNCLKFLRLCNNPDGIIRKVTEGCIYIKDSYLKMIKLIEADCKNDGTNGCVVIGTPGTGKIHLSLYFTFYLIRQYQETDIILNNCAKALI